MRRLITTTVILGVIFVGGILFGQNVSFDLPGISVGGNGDGDAVPMLEAITETVAEEGADIQEALDDFQIVLRDDRIYYNEREISMEELDELIAQAKAQEALIEVTYDADSVTGRFVEQLLDTLRAAEVKHIGISR